jgi:hypothetical protein
MLHGCRVRSAGWFAGRLDGAVVRSWDLPGQGDLFDPGGGRGRLGCAPGWLGWLDVLHLAGLILAESDI